VEAKKAELDRFVRAVKDPDVRVSIHLRKLAPDFARQQKETRCSLQEVEDKLRELTSSLTVLKAQLADEKASHGVLAPSTAGVYRVINNVFERLQILSTKIGVLEKRVHSMGNTDVDSPTPEIRRFNVLPTTPPPRGVIRGGSPGVTGAKSSPRTRGSPLRKTMLEEKLDHWETDEIMKDLRRKDTMRERIGGVCKSRQPFYTEAKV
jgi:hypothetical protein